MKMILQWLTKEIGSDLKLVHISSSKLKWRKNSWNKFNRPLIIIRKTYFWQSTRFNFFYGKNIMFKNNTSRLFQFPFFIIENPLPPKKNRINFMTCRTIAPVFCVIKIQTVMCRQRLLKLLKPLNARFMKNVT